MQVAKQRIFSIQHILFPSHDIVLWTVTNLSWQFTVAQHWFFAYQPFGNRHRGRILLNKCLQMFFTKSKLSRHLFLGVFDISEENLSHYIINKCTDFCPNMKELITLPSCVLHDRGVPLTEITKPVLQCKV